MARRGGGRRLLPLALAAAMALWTVFSETLTLDATSFKPRDAFKPPALDPTSSKPPGSRGDDGRSFPDGTSYTQFLATFPDRANRSAVVKSPLFKYFPDFCADCQFGKGVNCQTRAAYLRDKYGTKNPEQEVIKSRKQCKNPPLKIFWQDDGEDERDSMFALPRPIRANVTSAPLVNISIYFYETLGKDVGENLVEEMRKQYAQPNSNKNLQADIAIIDLFRTFPGRTDDPQKAELFVVPYAHASHCASKPKAWLPACNHISAGVMNGGVFNKLGHYKGNLKKRHVFLNVMNQGNSNPLMRTQPLTLTIGPRYSLRNPTNILVPYLNDLPSFQPSAIQGRDAGWWTRPRTYSVTFIFGLGNSRMRNSPREWRGRFLEVVQASWPDTIGGLPYAIRVMPNGRSPPGRYLSHLYKDSVFCPTLPGDTPPQKRFFDVIIMGCIPVVLSWTDGRNITSWHQPSGNSIEGSYPWISGSRSVAPEQEIDYRSFVVEVRGGVKNVRPTLERLMQNYTEIQQRQLNLMRYVSYFSYGMGGDAHKYPDAFSKILESLRYYLDNHP